MTSARRNYRSFEEEVERRAQKSPVEIKKPTIGQRKLPPFEGRKVLDMSVKIEINYEGGIHSGKDINNMKDLRQYFIDHEKEAEFFRNKK